MEGSVYTVCAAAAAIIVALTAQGCAVVVQDENCISPGETLEEKCSVCQGVKDGMAEFAQCKEGYQPVFVKKDQTGAKECSDAVGSDVWAAYKCEKADGDSTKCQSSDGVGGTDCYLVGSESPSCSEGYSGTKVGDSLGKFFEQDIYYYTCTPSS
eukprot:TRINITY_DN100122_c0_g1_i1.p1 TRINITY_DN100122_c0_g1~~TRINITY_DN100122_c0_g1_i1.p1  ORF type:complete len:169 (-),score=35.30 TRINITY_DN100122_c0_g1_i1:152-616(-)